MLDPFAICQSISLLIVRVKKMVDKYRDNQNECCRISILLKTVESIVKPLQQKGVKKDEGMSNALKGLEEALKCSSKVVETCLGKKAIYGFINAGSISKDLERVYIDICTNVNCVILAITARQMLMGIGIEKKLAKMGTTSVQHDAYVRRKMEKLAPNRERGAKKADVAIIRPKFKHQNDNVPVAASRTPRKRDANCTPEKLVDGQGHPRIIVTKMLSRSTMDVDMTVVTSIDMHPTRPWIVMGDMGGSFYIWDYNRKETVMKRLVMDSSEYNRIKEKTANHWFCSVKFIRKDNCLVVGNWWGSIRLYQYNNTNKLIEDKKFKVPREQPVTLLAVHPTKRYLLSASAYGTKIHLWDLNSNNWKIEREFDVKYAGAGAGAKGVLSLKFDPRDSNNFSCITDKGFMVGNIRSYSLTTKQTGLFKDHYFFSRTDLHFLVILSSDSHNAKIKDYETRDTVATFDMRERRMRFVAGHPTHPLVVIVLDDGTLCSWDGRNLQARAR